MRRARLAATLVGCAATLIAAAASVDPDAAVERFGRALVSRDVALIGPLLPREGKVQLRLVRMGPGTGFFSSSQVETLLRGFLDQGAVRSFAPARVDRSPEGLALARVRVGLTDREGRAVDIELRLGFRFEDGRWVLREIRESPS